MKVTKLENINFGSFKNFQWDRAVPEFHNKVNVLPGWNGCGKKIENVLVEIQLCLKKYQGLKNSAYFATSRGTQARRT